MKPKATLYVILALLLVAIPVLSACTTPEPEPTATTTQPPPTTTQAPDNPLPTVAGIDALLVYYSKCASCHGIQRQGGVGPTLISANLTAFTHQSLSSFTGLHYRSFYGAALDPALSNVLINYLKATP
ncbi:cytochrome c [Dehalogenimonas sp. THU2]|uniref:cytochrome c n=1 Tax=Dehalogenimonas sp. THU2 TaxID=3151121 RepID=UPI00321868FA